MSSARPIAPAVGAGTCSSDPVASGPSAVQRARVVGYLAHLPEADRAAVLRDVADAVAALARPGRTAGEQVAFARNWDERFDAAEQGLPAPAALTGAALTAAGAAVELEWQERCAARARQQHEPDRKHVGQKK